jgi:mono/diheme cytochrome c family protein
MNKNINGILTAVILAGCTAQKQTLYELPSEMKPEVKTEYQKRSDEGYTLYRQNCAGCHTKTEGGRTIIPDFRAEQLRGYELREANAKHESRLGEDKLTTDELGKIMTFLTYKKKNTAG